MTVASALLGFCLLAAPAHAQTYNVALDTSQLTQGDYSLDLQLNSGDAGLSTVDVGNFVFGGNYVANGAPSAQNGTTGDLSHTVSLHIDSADPNSFSYAEFTQGFSGGGSPDSFLTFQVDASHLISGAGGNPDTFVFALLDSTNANNSVNGTSLLTLTNDGAGGYTATTGGYTGRNNQFYQTAASPPSATPELGTVTSLGLLMGLFGLGALRARRGRARGAAGAE